ncbi:hypothetical protein J2S49_001253 [Arcanobacterium wilhelmae]|uniref:Uncharacterized protein n=1 Tax=Arcanobacterium wilhelmae TaxID=1803177 RepID=A0ABT9NBT4_9ACTO|nr:hypothetical protein [Arcanobacterium wilhelmae]MDP9801177.1 hypothetical protein [Arcanobacterium wilhelmae]WFN90529.1 hypothetical protein P8A24_01315 [Arcanobacterium wilhelmae]
MEFNGYAVAAAVFLLLGVVVPRFALRRSVIADSALEERYSEDLRIVRQPRLAMADSGESGTIYTTERTMDQRQRKISLKEVARGRSKARARMATRAAYRARGYLALGVAGALAISLWIGVGAASLPTWPAIIATLATGFGAIGLGYLVSEWTAGDDADREEITTATELLARAKRQRGRAQTDRRELAAEPAEAVAPNASVAPAVDVEPDASATADGAGATHQKHEPVREAGAGAVARPGTARKPAARAKIVRPAAKAETPSYTLKRRTVAPYEPAVADEAQVPFRPKRAGERVGNAPVQAANPAPEMTGLEELRSGLLAGGSTLDELLAKRRA